MMTDAIDACDWRGAQLDCSACTHCELKSSGGCKLMHACVRDRYARRIDRFFAWNPALANDYLDHDYFEVRAVAAKYADVFHLTRLLHDGDETVRWSAAQRLPPRYVRELRNDSHREVRIRVATRVEGGDLFSMRLDEDYYVRMTVARRLSPWMLHFMMGDSEASVRRIVAQRIEARWLARMVDDPDADVRLDVAQRLTAEQLVLLQRDSDCRVRHEVASRIDTQRLAPMLEDPDEVVREAAQRRVSSLASISTYSLQSTSQQPAVACSATGEA